MHPASCPARGSRRRSPSSAARTRPRRSGTGTTRCYQGKIGERPQERLDHPHRLRWAARSPATTSPTRWVSKITMGTLKAGANEVLMEEITHRLRELERGLTMRRRRQPAASRSTRSRGRGRRAADRVRVRPAARLRRRRAARSTATGVMRLATARDEILPQRDPRVRENEAYLTVLLLSRVDHPARAPLPEVTPGHRSRACSPPTWPSSRTSTGGSTRRAPPRSRSTCPACDHDFTVDVAGGRLGES